MRSTPGPSRQRVDQATSQLAQAKANLQLAQINTKRDTPLAEARAIARSQLDNDLQTQAADEASVKAQEAAVETAQLNLGWTKVRSLLDGIAGIAATQVGSLVKNDTVLTTVSQVQPIKVYFAISEQEYLALSKKAREGGAADLLHASSRVPIELTLSNGNRLPEQGLHRLRRSRGESPDRHHSGCGGFPQSAEPAASRTIRQGTCADPDPARRTSRSAARRDRTAGLLPDRRRESRTTKSISSRCR